MYGRAYMQHIIKTAIFIILLGILNLFNGKVLARIIITIVVVYLIANFMSSTYITKNYEG